MHMPKVGLLTVHCSTNFGASLQAYALSCYLRNRGNQVEIINYRFNYFLDVHDELYKKGNIIRYIIKKYGMFFLTYGRYMKFHEFENKYLCNETQSFQKKEDWEALNGRYDYCIVGSDQVWNPDHIKYDEAFFFEYLKNVTKISFAASIGKGELTTKELKFLNKYVKEMDYVSVREESAKKILSANIKDRTIEVHADPVFLLSDAYWRKLERELKIPHRYAVVYVLGKYDVELCKQIIKNLKDSYKIIIIKPRIIGRIGKYNIGPCEYLYLIDHAELVLTNSFHGAAFSILFNKQLIALKSEGKNERLSDLFDSIGISNVQIDSYKQYVDKKWFLDEAAHERVLHFIDVNKKRVDKYFDQIGI